MPKSDTWPDGAAMEAMRDTDSAESCDSMVSLNSSYSDDSLQYLSAEEKACLMFLEETIESLDTEEDSGVSNDEAECLPAPGNVATKTAHLSASMDQSKHKDVPKLYIDDPSMFGSSEHNQILNYLVPTPFVVANNNAHFPSKKATAASKEKLPPRDEGLKKGNKKGSRVPSEVNVVVIPPPVSVKSGNARDPPLQNDRSPRGPLTYDGLVQLRQKVASRKKPDDEKQPSAHQDPIPSMQNIHQSNKSNSPAVAPKPKKIPSHIAVLNHKGVVNPNIDPCLSTSPGSGGLMKPAKVRLEALSKLGLLKDSDEKPFRNGNPTGIHVRSFVQPSSASVPDLSRSRTLAPCAVRNQDLRTEPSQGSNIVQHHSMTDLTTVPFQSHQNKVLRGRAATLERSGMGLGSSMGSYEHSEHQRFGSSVSENQQCSSTMVGSNNLGNIQSTGKVQAPGQSTVPPLVQKPSQGPGLNVLLVPNMGQDRQEALRKLGLLKN